MSTTTALPPTPNRRKRPSLGNADRRAGYTMLLPAGIVIVAVTLFPIVYSAIVSFNSVSLTDKGYKMSFNGLQNYSTLVHSGVFWHAVWFTVMYAVVTVIIELALGMLIALAVNNVQRLKNVSIVVMLVPWALITVMSAQMWRYMYSGVYGVINYVFQSVHIITQPVTWLATPISAIISMMVADVWKTTPFVVIILLSGLQMIPNEFYEAAHIDGASAWKTFWNVTLPSLGGSIALAGLFRILQAFGVFDLPYVLTQGGPGNATQSLAILGQYVLFGELHFGVGAAIAVATVILVLGVSLVFLTAFRSMVEGGEA